MLRNDGKLMTADKREGRELYNRWKWKKQMSKGRKNNIDKRTVGGKSGKEITKTKDMVLIGLAASLLCVMGPFVFVLPVSPVPVSVTSLGIYLSVYVLGKKQGCISCLVYLLLGFIGLPVFSGFTGGAGKLFGPTGGYLVGYVFMAMVSGFFVERWREKKYVHFLGMVFGNVVCYGIGTIWLVFQAGIDFQRAFLVGVLPFILGDIIKIFVAMVVGPKICQEVQKAGLK